MRILTVVRDLGPGGTQRVAQNFALGYSGRGHDSAVLAIHRGGPRQAALRDAGVPCWTADGHPGAVATANAWRPDVIHVHREGWADAAFAAVLEVLARPMRRIVETNVFARPDHSRSARLIDLHFHLSRWCIWKWRRWTARMEPEPIGCVLPNPVDAATFYRSTPDEIAEFKTRHRIPSGAFVFGRVGQPILWKWSHHLFDAFTAFCRRRPDSVLVLAGLPPELHQQLERLPERVRARVRVVPFLKSDHELRACYSAMDAFLHVSRIGESFGMVLAEAMLCGVPVVTLSTPTKDNTQLEIVRHLEGGLVAASPADVVSAMEHLYSDVSLRSRLAARCSDSVRARFDLSVVLPRAEQYLAAVCTSATRSELRDALSSTAITSVSDDDIEALLSRCIGRTRRLDRLVMHAVHDPIIYRTWRAMSSVRAIQVMRHATASR